MRDLKLSAPTAGDEATEEEKRLHEGRSVTNFQSKVRIGGGTIGCDKISLAAWHKAFYRTFERYIVKKWTWII